MNNCDCVNCSAARAISVSNALVMTIKFNCQSAIEAEAALHLALVDLMVDNTSLDVESLKRLRGLLDDARQRKAELEKNVNTTGGAA